MRSKERKKGQPFEIVLPNSLACARDHKIFSGPYRARTGDLHNAIVALSQTELTAQLIAQNIPIGLGKVNEKFLAGRSSFWYFTREELFVGRRKIFLQ